MCMHVSMLVNTACIHTGACRGLKRAVGPLELELWVVVSCPMWVLATKLGFCGKVVRILKSPGHFSSPK